jgi:hypothetical protein
LGQGDSRGLALPFCALEGKLAQFGSPGCGAVRLTLCFGPGLSGCGHLRLVLVALRGQLKRGNAVSKFFSYQLQDGRQEMRK